MADPAKDVRIARGTFDLWLALTAYVGAIQYSRERTFFVMTGEWDQLSSGQP